MAPEEFTRNKNTLSGETYRYICKECAGHNRLCWHAWLFAGSLKFMHVPK
ncbi:hypothetical protein B4168_1804 [Anoxybacillus flavithermus]|nr:hypothetical protein B4168_1804 [Anoxybacillus flavithermus]OAO83863.1 hypothetical protein GT23_3998 [Parageobacillus thermoglucosidasius]